MSRYFARLVQRAVGAEPKASAAPPVVSAAASSDAHDPFATALPLEPTPAAATTRSSLSQEAAAPALPQTFSEQVMVPAPPSLPPQPPITTRAEADDAFSPEPPRLKPTPPAITPSLNSPVQELPTMPAPPVRVEHTRVEREVVRAILEPAPPLSSSVQAIAAPPKNVAGMVAEVPLAPPLTPSLPPPTPPPPQASTPPRPPLRLAPANAPPVVGQTAVTPQQPRLVIGRMNVEVVPVTPVQVAPAPAVRRSRIAPRATPAPSHLNFGLGQM